MDGTTLERAQAAKRKMAKHLAGEEMVQGIGICRVGTGYGVKFNISINDEADEADAEVFRGVPVLVEVVGTIRALEKKPKPEKK